MSTICPICIEHNLKHTSYNNDIQDLECLRCGTFKIRKGADTVTFQYFQHKSDNGLEEGDYLSETSVRSAGIKKAPEILGPKGSRKRANASAWLFNTHGHLLSFSDIYNLGSVKPPSVTERVALLLKELERDSDYMGATVDLKKLKYISVSWSLNTEEYAVIVNHLQKSGYITGSFMLSEDRLNVKYSDCEITTEGWQYLESIESIKSNSNHIFIAMWFSNNLDRAYDASKKAIESCDMRPVRVDDIEHVGKIDDRIMYEIKQSRCIIADFTGHRGGVYFEAGYAMGLDIPVIWTCRKDDLDKLHFDIRQYSCISWVDENELQERLTIRLKSIL